MCSAGTSEWLHGRRVADARRARVTSVFVFSVDDLLGEISVLTGNTRAGRVFTVSGPVGPTEATREAAVRVLFERAPGF